MKLTSNAKNKQDNKANQSPYDDLIRPLDLVNPPHLFDVKAHIEAKRAIESKFSSVNELSSPRK
jgi:hypothetical protein